MNDLLYKVQTRFLFHAHIRIKIPAVYDDAVFDELFAVMETVDHRYNSYRAGSYIDTINKNAGCFVEVDDETVRLLKEAISFSKRFDGAYDITVMPLIRLWGFYREKVERIPSKQEIEAVKSLVDYRRIEINGNRARIGKGQEIVTGSFIKAYAVDRLVRKMKALGIRDGIVNAGGSTIFAIGPDSGSGWEIAFSDPVDDSAVYTLSLCNRCFSTSSQTETFVTAGGKRYGHILDPRTGYPSPNRLVCIVSHSCMTGDILSTALFNETRETFVDKMALVSEKIPIEGFLVDECGYSIHSSGFPADGEP